MNPIGEQKRTLPRHVVRGDHGEGASRAVSKRRVPTGPIGLSVECV
jgi:hypothetical protein